MKDNKVKLLLSLGIVLSSVMLGVAGMAFAAISPATLTATLAPGESITETSTIDMPILPPRADVAFSFDLTGSMGGILNTAKSQSAAIMSDLDVLGVDINYAVVSYMDYPGYGYSAAYGYENTRCSDYAYSLDQAVTGNRTAFTTAINGLAIGCGGDGPEDYARIFYESYADPSMGWRTGTKKILVNFGDSVPHDNNLNEGIPGKTGTWSTGGDPGRDGVMFSADDLDLQTVLTDMAANNVVLLESHTTTGKKGYWDYWTGITGGEIYVTSSSTMADDVVNAITLALTTPNVTGLHLEASQGYESWIQSVTPASYSGPANVTVEFELTIKVPGGTPDGVYTFTISTVDDSGVSYNDQDVTITVVSNIRAQIDIDPDTLNLKFLESGNKCCHGRSRSRGSWRGNERGVTAYIELPEGQDVADVNVSTVLLNDTISAKLHPSDIGDYDNDGIPDLMVKFDRGDVIDLVKALNLNLSLPADIELTVSGSLTEGTRFEGSDTIRVIEKGSQKSKPKSKRNHMMHRKYWS